MNNHVPTTNVLCILCSKKKLGVIYIYMELERNADSNNNRGSKFYQPNKISQEFANF